MNWIPYTRFTLHCPENAGEAIYRLRRNAEAKEFYRNPSDDFYTAAAYEGTVSGLNFKIRRIAKINTSQGVVNSNTKPLYKPWYTGSVVAAGNGSVLKVRARLQYFAYLVPVIFLVLGIDFMSTGFYTSGGVFLFLFVITYLYNLFELQQDVEIFKQFFGSIMEKPGEMD